jgi:hypothetical protein
MLALLPTLPPATRAALADTRIEIEDRTVALVGASSRARGQIETSFDGGEIIAAIDDGQEFSFILPEVDLPRLAAPGLQLRIERPYRFLKLDAVLPWTTVGYGAAIFTTLAQAGISAGMLSGFSTDYLLIPATSLSAAVEALTRLFDQARRET